MCVCVCVCVCVCLYTLACLEAEQLAKHMPWGLGSEWYALSVVKLCSQDGTDSSGLAHLDLPVAISEDF